MARPLPRTPRRKSGSLAGNAGKFLLYRAVSFWTAGGLRLGATGGGVPLGNLVRPEWDEREPDPYVFKPGRGFLLLLAQDRTLSCFVGSQRRIARRDHAALRS